MNVPVLDRELLTRVVRHAVGAPNWRQDVYYAHSPDCGTVMCIAGFAAIMFGGWEPIGECDEVVLRGVWVRDPVTGDVDLAPDVARRLLGLTFEEADVLFQGENGALDLLRACGDILAGVYRKPLGALL